MAQMIKLSPGATGLSSLFETMNPGVKVVVDETARAGVEASADLVRQAAHGFRRARTFRRFIQIAAIALGGPFQAILQVHLLDVRFHFAQFREGALARGGRATGDEAEAAHCQQC